MSYYQYMVKHTPAATSTKPCQNCGEPIPVGIIACSACQREWMIAFRKSHAWLFEGRAATA